MKLLLQSAMIFFGTLMRALLAFAIALAAGYGVSRNLARSGWAQTTAEGPAAGRMPQS